MKYKTLRTRVLPVLISIDVIGISFVAGVHSAPFIFGVENQLGALPSPLVSDMGNSELTVGYVSDTPSDEKYRTNHRFIFDALSPEQVDEECATPWDDDVFACARPWNNQVVMPNPCLYPKEAYASVLCHEMAHLKGWEHEPDLIGWRYWDQPARRNYVELNND